MKPGGTLVYITCSILDEENGAQAAAFAAAHPEFEVLPAGPRLDAVSAGASSHAHLGPAGGVLLTPLTAETDGFFAFLIRRR